jgi:hypothetical protein
MTTQSGIVAQAERLAAPEPHETGPVGVRQHRPPPVPARLHRLPDAGWARAASTHQRRVLPPAEPVRRLCPWQPLPDPLPERARTLERVLQPGWQRRGLLNRPDLVRGTAGAGESGRLRLRQGHHRHILSLPGSTSTSTGATSLEPISRRSTLSGYDGRYLRRRFLASSLPSIDGAAFRPFAPRPPLVDFPSHPLPWFPTLCYQCSEYPLRANRHYTLDAARRAVTHGGSHNARSGSRISPLHLL